ncbi:MAG: folate-binding protein YgfZ [Nitratireductor sp.]|nr:folate-binding protein YgfZ [Nitratireductor sp.]
MTKFARLTTRALIRVGGEDAAKFLQALITCDVDHLAPGQAHFGALLTPQGKILFDFFVVRSEDGFLVDVDARMRDDLVKRLNFYKLRAKVEIAPAGEAMQVFAVWDGEAQGGGIAFPDPRLSEMGTRFYGEAAPQGEEADYDAHRLVLGMPEGGVDYAYGDTFPHEALMDQFDGVDFAKGCYVGQEVVSRMQHRGTARKRVIMVEREADGGGLPDAGTAIEAVGEAGGKNVGVMGSSLSGRGLAMLRLDRVAGAQAAGTPLMAGKETITARLQPWVKFGWPRD